jgi:hypothetical protein
VAGLPRRFTAYVIEYPAFTAILLGFQQKTCAASRKSIEPGSSQNGLPLSLACLHVCRTARIDHIQREGKRQHAKRSGEPSMSSIVAITADMARISRRSCHRIEDCGENP